MIVYASTKVNFREDVRNNQIVEKILADYRRNLGHSTSRSEMDSWKNSMMYMSNILEDNDIPDDTGVAIDSDSWAGDFENSTYTQATDAVTTNAYDLSKGQDVTALKASMAVAGNTVAFTRTDIDDVTGEDTTINKFAVTRPLASGATFEATYTSISDDKSTTTDADILDLELAVKF